jgi:hypothetical protein
MVKQGRFTVELVSADSKVKFQQHTKDGKTYVEVEPEAEYFVRVAAEPAPLVRGRIDVDGKSLGYKFGISTRVKDKEKGLRGLYSTALMFAKAKVVNHSTNDEPQDAPAPFWTGNEQVQIVEEFDTGKTHTSSRKASQNKWDGGEDNVGFVIGQTDPKKKGIMTTKGNFVSESTKYTGVHRKYKKGRLLETIQLNYCSTVGLIVAGVLGPFNSMEVARKLNEHKRGAAQVAADSENTSVRPKKIRMVQEMTGGQSVAAPKDYDFFDLTDE